MGYGMRSRGDEWLASGRSGCGLGEDLLLSGLPSRGNRWLLAPPAEGVPRCRLIPILRDTTKGEPDRLATVVDLAVVPGRGNVAEEKIRRQKAQR